VRKRLPSAKSTPGCSIAREQRRDGGGGMLAVGVERD
jgi:hypothetical protein